MVVQLLALLGIVAIVGLHEHKVLRRNHSHIDVMRRKGERLP